jgi:hypothetical protein
VFAFEEAFGVPAGHTLREVASAPLARPGVAGGWRSEHEEYDARGALVAVYESWASGHGCGFVKYSPHGWVLRRSDAPPWAVAGSAGGGAASARPEAA